LKNKGDRIIIYSQKRRRSNKTFLAFLAILGFVAFYVPVFGSTLRYQTGTAIKYIFNNFGYLCLVLGATSLLLNFLKVFGGRISYKGMLLSGLLLWIGAFLTDAPFIFLGIAFGGDHPVQGYHFLMELF
jgi:hypothetical protein